MVADRGVVRIDHQLFHLGIIVKIAVSIDKIIRIRNKCTFVRIIRTKHFRELFIITNIFRHIIHLRRDLKKNGF